MATKPDEYIEIASDGIRFMMEHQSITTNEKTLIPREEVSIDEMPIDNIVINGVTNIESVDDGSGTVIRMKYDEVEYTNTADGDGEEDEIGFFEKVEAESGVKFDRSSQEFVFGDDRTDKENFVNFIRVLFEHNHITKEDLPYQTKYARDAYLINTEPKDQNGDPMERVGEPVDGVFVATHYGQKQKRNYLKQLVNDFVKGESISQ